MPTERFSQVLVVEDNDPERRLLCEILKEDGFDAVGCGCAEDALEQVHKKHFAVAVVDLRLPDLDGTELLDRIRRLDERVEVIIYTGAASFDSVKDAINLGAFAYVEKLSDPSELLRHVHRAFHERVGRYAKDLETAVRQRTEELARSNRELEKFASIVAHDLRSPLLTISGYCQILREEYAGRLEPGACEYLDHVVAGVTRMNRLIEDLLDYSRVGRSTEPFGQVNLDSVVAEALANLDAAIRQCGAQVDAGPMPVVFGVRTLLLQLFQNLLDNAVKFRGTTPPAVCLRATQDGDHWQFSVQDNGVGIDPGHFEQLFQVFHRLHGREYPGTGIGLALCKKIVDLHGGRIWPASRPGEGTTFFFTLSNSKPAKGQ
jgi:light-regulated signal transduction histidine kinase (bacteriophytochrome)